MKVLPSEQGLQLWSKWWGELKEEWFKIEVLQDYSGEDQGPSLGAWLAGDREKSIRLMPEYAEAWIAMCQKSLAKKRRFRIVEKPFSPYLEWEIELYKRVNIPLVGEEVWLVQKEDVAHLSIPDGDVMIFDFRRVVRNHYSKQGLVERMEFYEKEKDDISSFLKLREELPAFGKVLN